jgi:hypothetical protein
MINPGNERPVSQVNVERNRYPYCLVWTPLPLITALFPFIGHTGICTSSGVIHDFSGSYTVSVDDMGFGDPTRYVQLDISEIDQEEWDDCVRAGDLKYNTRCHNLFCDNCHSHCAYVLNKAKYQGGNWNMVSIAWVMFIKGKSTGFLGFLKTYIGFFALASVVFIFIYKPF